MISKFFNRLAIFCFVWILIAFHISTSAQSNLSVDSLHVQKGLTEYRKAFEAFRNKDYALFFNRLMKAKDFFPTHPRLTYNLAQASMLINDLAGAQDQLTQLAGNGLYFDFLSDTLFASVKSNDAFLGIKKRFDENREPRIKSEKAFELQEMDLANEGLAYDSQADIFFISSIHKRKIISINANGKATDYSSPGDSLYGVYGLRVDPAKRQLWACSIAVPQMKGYKSEMDGLSFLCCYDLKTGKLIRKYYLPAGSKHGIKDVTITGAGDVYFTDMTENTVYKIDKKNDKPKRIVRLGYFGDPLGIDCTVDGQTLFIADNLQGIFTFDTKTSVLKLLALPANTTAQGIDGLYFREGYLIATQNGVNPVRVIKYTLDKRLTKIEKAETLESNYPDYDWPTLGVIHKNHFYYVANSQWNNFNQKGEVVSRDKLKKPLVLKLRIEN